MRVLERFEGAFSMYLASHPPPISLTQAFSDHSSWSWGTGVPSLQGVLMVVRYVFGRTDFHICLIASQVVTVLNLSVASM